MTLTFRRGSVADSRALYDVFRGATAVLERNMLGTPDDKNIWLDPGFVEGWWQRNQALYQHLARTAEHFWVAEKEGQIVGFARSSLHDGVRELLEFFVLPEHQGGGVGRELLARAFPAEGARRRMIIATSYIGALSRYLKAGVYPRFPIYMFSHKPQMAEVATDLTFEQITATPEALAALRAIDREIIGYARDVDHQFLLEDRKAYLYRRGEQVVGYGYFGKNVGPIALLDEADYPAVLAPAESEAAQQSEDDFHLHVPLINRAAVGYLLGRGFRMEPFTVFFMSDEPFGRFENYVLTSPPFFV